MKVDIRRAKPEEADMLTRIAFAAKRHWGYPERWISLWKEALTLTPDFILNNEVLAATLGGEVVGFYALVREGPGVVLEHLWVVPDYIGAGIGKELFDHAASQASALSATAIEIDSDPNAEGFYLRMGARRVGETLSTIEGTERRLPRLVFDLKPEA